MVSLPRAPLLLALTVLGTLLLPTVAAAGTAELTISTFSGRADESVLFAHLVYTARPGEANRLHVSFDATGATIIDRAGVDPGRGCARIQVEESMEVRCDFAGATVAELRISLGDRADVTHVLGRIPEYEADIGGGWPSPVVPATTASTAAPPMAGCPAGAETISCGPTTGTCSPAAPGATACWVALASTRSGRAPASTAATRCSEAGATTPSPTRHDAAGCVQTCRATATMAPPASSTASAAT